MAADEHRQDVGPVGEQRLVRKASGAGGGDGARLLEAQLLEGDQVGVAHQHRAHPPAAGENPVGCEYWCR